VSAIGPGLLLFVGVGADDGFGEYDRLAEKVFHLGCSRTSTAR
jgi:D-Tyr-tRNAtyr deacylase